MIEHILCFGIIQKPMEKSYWLFVDWTNFWLTADPQLIATNTHFPQNINDQNKTPKSELTFKIWIDF